MSRTSHARSKCGAFFAGRLSPYNNKKTVLLTSKLRGMRPHYSEQAMPAQNAGHFSLDGCRRIITKNINCLCEQAPAAVDVFVIAWLVA